VEAIRRELGDQIVAATGVMPNNDFIVVNGKVREVGINGVDEYYPTVRSIVSLAGRLIDAGDVASHARVAIVTQKLAQRLYGNQQAAVLQHVRINQLEFTIIGTFREKTSTFGQSEVVDETILIPYTVIRYFVQFERVDPLWMQVRRASDVPRVTAEVQRILESRHRAGARYMVQNLKAILDTANQIATVLTVVLILVSAIALIISGIGIMNIMLVTVTERTREIGVRMAVGASRHDILGQFLTESVLISLIGGAIGIIIGLALPLGARLLTDQVRVPVSPASVAVAFLVSFTVGIGFGLFPANRASKMNPTEALRYE
jgi:putative ABC transport system permease protein